MNDTSTSHIHNNDKTPTQSKQTDAEKYYGRFPFLSFSFFFYYLNNFGSNRKNHNLANFI